MKDVLHVNDETIYAFQRNTVVAASAGTGKTHRLTSLYALLVLGLTSKGQQNNALTAPAISPSKIVATTFSRAAAAEMRERIEAVLTEVSSEEEPIQSPFGVVLQHRLALISNPPTRAELRKRAQKVIGELPFARIDTLHGLSHHLVKSFSTEFGYGGAPEILEEAEYFELIEMVVQNVLGQMLEESSQQQHVARTFLRICGGVLGACHVIGHFLDQTIECGVSFNEMTPVAHALSAKQLFRNLIQHCSAMSNIEGTEFQRLSQTILSENQDQFVKFSENTWNAISSLLTLRKPSGSRCTPEIAEFAEFRENLPGRTHADRAELLMTFLMQASALEISERNIVSMLERISMELDAEKRKLGKVSFGDLLQMARNGLRDFPLVRQEIQQEIDVLLVDEFQDSSEVQRQLVYLLRHQGNDATIPSPGQLYPSGLYIVGDRKQSIYGFRGADVSVFTRVCVELASSAASDALGLSRQYKNDSYPCADFVTLQESRRSAKRIVDFVNAFCQFDFAMHASASVESPVQYSEAEHLRTFRGANEREGEVLLVQNAQVDTEEDKGTNAGPLQEALLAARSIRMLRSKTSNELGKSIPWKDIAILVRRRSSISLVEYALEQHSIPYVVSGRAFFGTREVRDVAAFLRLILDPHDRLALATVLRGPWVGLSDLTLLALSDPNRGLSLRGVDSMHDILIDQEDEERYHQFRKIWPSFQQTAVRLRPSETIRLAMELFLFDHVLAMLPKKTQTIANVEKLIQMAAERGDSLFQFSQWLDQRIDDESDETEASLFSDGDDAVRIATIHGAKGLDFPTVFVMDLNVQPRARLGRIGFMRDGEKHQLVVRHSVLANEQRMRVSGKIVTVLSTPVLEQARSLAKEKEWAERCRLTYVALTRAKERLVLIEPSSEPREMTAWQTFCRGLEEHRWDNWVQVMQVPQNMDEWAVAQDSSMDTVISVEPPPTKPMQSAGQSIQLATTHAAMFEGCPRRFYFRHLLGVDETNIYFEENEKYSLKTFVSEANENWIPGESDPREMGRVSHRILESFPLSAWGTRVDVAMLRKQIANEGIVALHEVDRMSHALASFLESSYAKQVATAERVLREYPFRLSVPPLILHGTMDLVVFRTDGIMDVIDYKQSRPTDSLDAYAFQLKTYALALSQRYPDFSVRAGVVFLGHRNEPTWLWDETVRAETLLQDFQCFLKKLCVDFSDCRHRDSFPGVPIERCRKLHCGFIQSCYGDCGRPFKTLQDLQH